MLGCCLNNRSEGRNSIMSAFIDSSPDLAALRDDLAMLKRDVTGLVEHLRSAPQNQPKSASRDRPVKWYFANAIAAKAPAIR
jgi:hypothetical protein